MTDQDSHRLSAKRRDRRAQENLDTRITLVPNAYKFALAGLFLCAAAVGLWGFLGSILIEAGGSGIIVPADQQVFAVQSESVGRIREIAVAAGDDVSAHDVLAELSQRDLDNQIFVARGAVHDLETSFEALKERLAAEVTRHEKTTTDVQALFSKSIRELELVQESQASLLRDEEGLEKRGRVTRTTLLSTRVARENTIIELAKLRTKLAEAWKDLADLKDTVARQIDKAEVTLNAKRRELTTLEAKRKIDRTVRAPVAGRIAEIRIALGENVVATDVIMTLRHGGPGKELIAFLKPDQARRVKIGMAARVVPSSVNKAEFGAIRGTVSSVSHAPVSRAYADSFLRNEQLAERMTSDGATYLAWINLVEDPKSASGFKWWSGDGPNFAVKSGTLAQVEIILEKRAPVTLVVPALRELLGF